MNNEATFDPWRHCLRLGINIVRTPLQDARGYTDGHSTIWVHDGLSLCEERVTVCHELVHLTQGHCGPQPPEVEDLVRMVTARWMIPWHHLMGGWSSGRFDVPAIARDLCVTSQVVLDRISYATAQELAMLEETLCDSRAA